MKEKKISLKDVQKALIRLSAHYPEARHTPESLKVLSGDYFEALKHLDVESFNLIMRMTCSTAPYYPKICQLLQQERRLEDHRRGQRTCLSDNSNEVLTNAENVKGPLKLVVFKKFRRKEISGAGALREYARIDQDFEAGICGTQPARTGVVESDRQKGQQ